MMVQSDAGIPRVAVVGSLVMDLIFRTERRPAAGETVFGESFQMCPGGKGFNQAIAARRAGAEVVFVGRVGADDFGEHFRSFLAGEGIAPDFLTRDEQAGTGVACPIVDTRGENSIVMVPRANMRVTPDDVERAVPALRTVRAVLLQHEIPAAASLAAARGVKDASGLVVLNPAPAAPLDPLLLELVDVLVPNEHEAEYAAALPGEPVASAIKLHEWFGMAVVLTQGAGGATIVDRHGPSHVPACEVECVDSTGAGDAFCGALAVALAEGRDLRGAVAFAAAAGAVSVTRPGTGPAMPRRDEIERLVGIGGPSV